MLRREGVLPAVAVFFVCTVWVPAAVMAVLLLMGMRSWWTPASVLTVAMLAILWHVLFRSLSRTEALRLAALVLGSILLAAAVSIFIYDVSWDGRSYHADAIMGMLDGVNPIYSPIPAVVPVYANHYPKATWYFAALVIHLFHNYQLGKIYTFLLMFACAAYAASFFRRQGLSGGYCVVLVAATALNPVAASQMTSYYIDGALASLITLMVMAAASMVFRPARFDHAIFVLSASLAIAMKFTALPYAAAVACGVIATRLLFRRQHETGNLPRALSADAVSVVAAFFLGVLVLGYSPYITNIRQGLHPLYPVLGQGKIDFLTANTPPVLRGKSYNRAHKFLISFFAQTRPGFTENTVMKVPFTVRKQELLGLATPDVRMAGWGVFFSGVTLSSLALFLLVKGWRGNASIVLGLVLVAVTSFINPECWMARYTPQIALFPVLLLMPELRASSGPVRTAAQVLCLILLLNNLLTAGAATAASFIKSRRLDASFASIARTGGPGEYWAYRDPKSRVIHYEQFSGLKGIVICGALDPPRQPLPADGFPLTTNITNETQVTLFKGSCSSSPPL